MHKIASAAENLKGDQMLAIAGQLADAESLVALKDLFNRQNSENLQLDSIASTPVGFTSARSNYTLNATIAGIEQADYILLVGTNPRHEAPILNTRIRKSYLHNGLEIGLVGEKANLNYDFEHFGTSSDALDQLLSSSHKLFSAKRPAIIVGQSIFDRPDTTSSLKKIAQLVTKLQQSALPEWKSIYNVLQTVIEIN